MSMLFIVMLGVQIIVARLLVALILLQQGKGATAGASFGGGASETVFGARGSANFLSTTTAVFATIFLFNSLFLGYLFSNQTKESSVLDKTSISETVEKAISGDEKDTDIPVVPN